MQARDAVVAHRAEEREADATELIEEAAARVGNRRI